ncbi:MAG: (d)CMP kinase [Burkholderiaceae bacterium]
MSPGPAGGNERSAGPVPAPVIAIDGPTASGKGTIAQRVASALGWHYLDSGALYRLTALGVLRGLAGAPAAEAVATGAAGGFEPAIARFAETLPARFDGGQILLAGVDVTDAIRAEAVGDAASRIAVMPAVRVALVARQRSFRRPPGLVADGRDMGSVIFPDAALKIFLTASAEARARRRHKQLIEKGFSVTFPALLRDLEARDHRDSTRSVAPLAPAEDAQVLDCTALGIDETVGQVLEFWAVRQE